MDYFFLKKNPKGTFKSVILNMKAIKFISISIIFLSFLLSGSLMLRSQEKSEIQQEFVEVINTELIVRALKKGKPVGDLKIEDFSLFENGQERKITSFMEIRRRIGTKAPVIDKSGESKTSDTRRLFLFYFWLYNPEPEHTETLDYFFKNIFRDGDYALLIIENQVFKITKGEDIQNTLTQVKTMLDQMTQRAKLEHDTMELRVERLFRDFEEKFRSIEHNPKLEGLVPARPGPSPRSTFLNQFVEGYKRLWDEYRYKRINLNVGKLKRIAESIKRTNFEKWGLVFYQHDTFPQFDPQTLIQEKQQSFGNDRELRKMADSISREINRPAGSLAIIQGIKEVFIGANATFHLLLTDVPTQDPMNSRYLKMGHVYSDWKEMFRTVSEATGGKVMDGKKLNVSLAQAMEKEDIYYRLTYAPEITDKKARKIEIKCKKKKLKIQYDPNVSVEKVGKIIVDNFSYDHPTLQFSLRNYQQLFDGNWMYGDMAVKITAVDAQGEMISFERKFEPEESAITASMKMNFPRGGKYSIIVEAKDNQTGESTIYSEKVLVPKTGLDIPVLLTEEHEKTKGIDKDNRLKPILKKAALYCEKLKKATFYFACKEEISDAYFIKGQEVKNDLYSHDYQIIMDDKGRMSEKRLDPADEAKKKNKKKRKKRKKSALDLEEEEGVLILTSFYSQNPFLLPVTLLGKERQKSYSFQLLAEEEVGGSETYKIRAELLDNSRRSLNHGIIWVDISDGSVIKLELDPRSLKGIETLQTMARRKGVQIKVTDIHWYEIKRDGIRFPSKTEISEAKLMQPKSPADKPKEVERSITVFQYKNYQFFDVKVNVTDTQHK
jgi:hypothetical protein